MRKWLRICLIIIFLLTLNFARFGGTSFADDPTPTPTPTPSSSSEELSRKQQEIKELEKKVTDLRGQANTLSSQIAVMDSQIRLTQLRINATKQEIVYITDDITITNKKISKLEQSLTSYTKLLLQRIVATYQIGSTEPLQILLYSSNVSDFVTRANYLRVVQAHDKKLIFETQQAKEDYANQKEIFEDKKKKVEKLKNQLEGYTAQLDQDKTTKQKLLAETEGSEANYQKLLSQARAQLAAFSNFTASRGGASILSNQTSCDDWGCYYNQRDSQWGNSALNNTSYTIASDGCLVTSMAMVYTHYGHRSVTPLSINSDSNNFASYYPAYLKYTITADGATSNRVGSVVDGELSAGNPVVVGVSYDGGPIPDHFVVLVSGSGGNYIMNDPFTPNGHKIPFTDHYSVGGIREIDKVVF